MTEADRERLMTEYARLSEWIQGMLIDGLSPVEALRYEKEHLLRCSFFADMLEDME